MHHRRRWTFDRCCFQFRLLQNLPFLTETFLQMRWTISWREMRNSSDMMRKRGRKEQKSRCEQHSVDSNSSVKPMIVVAEAMMDFLIFRRDFGMKKTIDVWQIKPSSKSECTMTRETGQDSDRSIGVSGWLKEKNLKWCENWKGPIDRSDLVTNVFSSDIVRSELFVWWCA